MKPEALLNALNDVEDDLILDILPPPQKRPRHLRLSLLLAAVFVVSSLALTALASGDGSLWFQRFFSGSSGTNLTNSQKTYIGENTATYQQSQTMNGYTITLDSAISDGVMTLIQFKVTAPEDVVLGLHHYVPENWSSNTLFVNELGQTYNTSGGWSTIDEDKTDNQLTLLYESNNTWYEKHIDQIFGHTWTIRLVGLKGEEQLTPEKFDNPPQPQHITDGVWEFQITFPEKGNETVEFVSDAAICPGMHSFHIHGFQEEDLLITSLKIRALGASLHFQHPEKGEISAEFDTIFAVMKDGSQIPLKSYYHGPGFLTFLFDAPIVPAEIDHILLPNGTRLPPQS